MTEVQFNIVISILGTAGSLIIILLSVIAYFVKGAFRSNEVKWAKQEQWNGQLSEQVNKHTEYIKFHEREEERQNAELEKLKQGTQEMSLVVVKIQERLHNRRS